MMLLLRYRLLITAWNLNITNRVRVAEILSASLGTLILCESEKVEIAFEAMLLDIVLKTLLQDITGCTAQ